MRAWCALPLFNPELDPPSHPGSVVQSIMNRERSTRPTSRSAVASSFWRGYAASFAQGLARSARAPLPGSELPEPDEPRHAGVDRFGPR